MHIPRSNLQHQLARFAMLAGFLLSPVAGTFSQVEEEVKIDSSIVIVNATIKDSAGRPISGLRKAQFSVFEDDVAQEIEFFSAEETPFAAVILLDTSGSMEERVSMARAAAIRFLDGLRESDVVAIYRFDSKISLVQEFSNSRDINENVFDLKADGMTKMYDAIHQGVSDLSKRSETRKAVIVLSDGQDTMSGRSADKVLKSALEADVAIYTVDMSPIGNSKRVQNQGALKNLAEKSGGVFVATPGGAALRTAFGSIVEELGTQYTLGYSPKIVKMDGKWRAIELRVSRPGLSIRTRKGYNAERSN